MSPFIKEGEENNHSSTFLQFHFHIKHFPFIRGNFTLIHTLHSMYQRNFPIISFSLTLVPFWTDLTVWFIQFFWPTVVPVLT